MVTDVPCMQGAQGIWFSLGRGMVVVVDPGSASGSGAVIRNQFVGSCILHC